MASNGGITVMSKTYALGAIVKCKTIDLIWTIKLTNQLMTVQSLSELVLFWNQLLTKNIYIILKDKVKHNCYPGV